MSTHDVRSYAFLMLLLLVFMAGLALGSESYRYEYGCASTCGGNARMFTKQADGTEVCECWPTKAPR